MLFNYATLRKKRVHLGKTFNSPHPLLDNFVEKNGGDVDEDYHVKRRNSYNKNGLNMHLLIKHSLTNNNYRKLCKSTSK